MSTHCRNNRNIRHFRSRDPDPDLMTFIYKDYKLDAYSLETHQLCKTELLTRMVSKVITLQTYRQTDRHN